MNGKIDFDVSSCPRCGKEHPSLAFRPFQKQQLDLPNVFSTCPETKEPILGWLRIKVDGSPEPEGGHGNLSSTDLS